MALAGDRQSEDRLEAVGRRRWAWRCSPRLGNDNQGRRQGVRQGRNVGSGLQMAAVNVMVLRQ
jgi:hypothetical protein